MTFIGIWVAYALSGIVLASAALVWAVRARQFMDQDRARRLALTAPDDGDIDTPPTRADRYTWRGLLLMALAVVAAATIMGLRNR